jgi:uncharacterized membrane protein
MNAADQKPALTLERRLANLLSFGTWAAAGLIAAGLMLAGLTADRLPGDFFSLLGIGLLISLPVVRIVVTGLVFLLRHELKYALIAGLVLLIVTVLLIHVFARGFRN